MSAAAFLRQYHATGREKGDGYDPSMFADMNPGELSEARAAMLRRALEGDTIDLAGLAHVGDTAAIAALREAAGTGLLRALDRDLVLRETLFALTCDPHELDPILAWVNGHDADARRRAAELLARLALPPTLAEPIARQLARWRLGAAATGDRVAVNTGAADSSHRRVPGAPAAGPAYPRRMAVAARGSANGDRGRVTGCPALTGHRSAGRE